MHTTLNRNKWGILLAAALLAGTFYSCQKNYTDPPALGAPDLVANTSIRDIKARYTGGNPVLISDDIILEGVVSCDDRSGNFYQQISLQDATGGILLRLAGNNLFNNFPVGRQVFVRCKGLYLGQYNGTIQLGGGIDSAYISQGGVTLLANNLQDRHLVRGALNQPLTPVVVTPSQLTTNLQDRYVNTLIKLVGYEFSPGDTSKTYADADQSGNRIVQGCGNPSQNRITLRSSNFANFATLQLPKGNGEITGVYSFFGSTKQLTIRDTSDVKFNGPRCGTGPTTLMNTSELRALFTGSTTFAPNGRRITGVVISDRSTNNLNNQNLFLQQGTGLSAICVRFGSAHSFNLGDSIDVNVSGQEISEFNGLLQLNSVPNGYATLISTGKTITPRTATFADISANFRDWESSLVRILNVTSLTGGTGGTWRGSVNMSDATGSLVAFTATGATFATATFPGSASSVTGYLTPFGATRQLSLRNPATDVVGGGGPPPSGGGIALTTSPYVQNFNNLASGLPQGFSVKIGATASSVGTGDMPIFGSGLSTPTAWNNSSAGLKNFASATGLNSASDATAQNASTNRALGIRQTSSAGYDPGSAYMIQLDNTTGKTNFQLSFLLQSLDASSGRTTTWTVDYGFGDTPSSFTPATTSPATITSSGTFGSTPVTVNFGAALNNQSQKVWIRIVVLTGTTGGGNRASTGLDDVQLSWN